MLQALGSLEIAKLEITLCIYDKNFASLEPLASFRYVPGLKFNLCIIVLIVHAFI